MEHNRFSWKCEGFQSAMTRPRSWFRISRCFFIVGCVNSTVVAIIWWLWRITPRIRAEVRAKAVQIPQLEDNEGDQDTWKPAVMEKKMPLTLCLNPWSFGPNIKKNSELAWHQPFHQPSHVSHNPAISYPFEYLSKKLYLLICIPDCKYAAKFVQMYFCVLSDPSLLGWRTEVVEGLH